MKNKTFKEKMYITLIYLVIISIFIIGIINHDVITNIINKIIESLIPFIYGGCFAYLLTPLCNKIENKLNKLRLNEKIAIICVETLFIIAIAIICIIILPQSIKSISDIIMKVPNTWNNIQCAVQDICDKNSLVSSIIGRNIKEFNNIVNNFINNTIIPNIDSILTEIVLKLTSLSKTVLNMFIGVIVSVFILNNRKNFAKQSNLILRAILNDKQYKLVIEELKVANKMFSRFFIGKIVDSLIVGFICFISLEILRIPYAVLVAVIVGLTNIIPVIGPFIGAIPGAIIIFSENPRKTIYFIIFIIILQQIDGNIIGPKCVGSTTGLSTFWVLFSIMFFGGLWGITGMLIGVPLFAVIFDIGNKVLEHLIKKKNIDINKL